MTSKMRIGKIKNRISGEVIKVTATDNHPDSRYGIPAWVDEKGVAYMEVDCKIPNPLYELIFDSNMDRKRIGGLVAELRQKKGYSTRKLAELSGISFANIGKIERGAYNVSIDILSKVCKALDAEVTITEKAAE